MDDLISRQAAIDAMHQYSHFDDFDISVIDEETAVIAIKELPSVQPDIIRCKDCKHQVKEWREDKRFKDNGYWVYGCEVISDICGYWALFRQDNEFCSEAERKE